MASKMDRKYRPRKPVAPGRAYNNYQFVDKDPLLDKIIDAIDESGVSKAQITAKSGVTFSTLKNWENGKTKRGLSSTMNAVLRAIGKELVIGDAKRRR